MSTQNGGRKKHLVEGDVKEIKKSAEATGLGKVGKGEGFLSSLIKAFTKNSEETTDKKEKRHF